MTGADRNKRGRAGAGRATGDDTGGAPGSGPRGSVARDRGRTDANPRRAALMLLEGVLDEGRSMADLQADPRGPLAALAPDQRARAQALALATLRHIGPADALLRTHLRKRPVARVENAMRMALAEHGILGVPAHAVADETVGLIRGSGRLRHQAGFVNAVLRRALPDAVRAFTEAGPQRLPSWLRAPMLAHYGTATVAAMEAAQAAPRPPVDLSLRHRADAAEWAARLGAEVLPTGGLRLMAPGQISALPGYDSGEWWVQDAAAALPAAMLAPAPGDTVVDLCAAPGGKTMQLVAAGARVTAVDLSARRMERLRANLDRTGLPAECLVADALEWQPPQPVQAVLLDAPCSATGTIRRHPDLPFAKRPESLAALVALQARLIDGAAAMLAPGGVLVYATCSLLPAEGEDQAAAALHRHPELRSDPLLPAGADPAWRTPEGHLRLRPDHWPERGGLDGFFIARFRRAG